VNAALSTTAVADLRSRLTGHAFVPGDDGYAAATTPWDLSVRIDAPVGVVAADASDIQAAARWAAENDLGVGILNTGHGVLDDQRDAVLINTAGLDAVRADAASRRVVVQPGARWAGVQAVVNPDGLSGVCGASPSVGVLGYTLGGGLSPIGRTFGMGADRVRRLTVLDADYRPLEVTAESDPELFWALCGGGGLGIVTEAEFEVVDLPALFGGGIYFPGTHAEQVLTAYRDWVATLDDRTTTSLALLHLPPFPELPEPLRGQYVVHLRVAHVDPADRDLEATGRALIAPLLASAPVIDDYTRVMPPEQLPDIHRDPVAPMPVAYRGGHVAALDDATVSGLLDAASPADGPAPALIELRHLGGAMTRSTAAPNSATARSSAFHLWVNSPMDPSDPEPVRALVDGIVSRVGATGLGAQLSFYGPAPRPGEILSLWEEDDAARLIAAARRLDPAGRIRTGRPLGAPVGDPS
jgi:FAD/FMN-containing dehydrogenase